MRVLLVTIALGALVACAPTVPNSAAGVGFDDYDRARTGQGQPSAATPAPATPLAAPGTVSAETLDGDPAPTPAPVADAGAVAGAPPAPLPTSISDEQDFGAVSGRETIESDAARIAANRAAYVQIEPTDLPPRPGETGPSIVAFALATNNPVGAPLYTRSRLSGEARFARNCSEYTSSDLAQQDFLRRGGPKRDPKGLDPDGDGFACYWDPTPLRQARAAAAAPAPVVSE
ncbi:hypothetical protein [Aliiroseovarius sp.]|uniref:hypothetical protein n=1 Tax=Aliiroseovarius sp. TaxID=1872442 RepID=UPI00262A2EB9|nr:hypothetical protein [Aliiroseovarius sp.]